MNISQEGVGLKLVQSERFTNFSLLEHRKKFILSFIPATGLNDIVQWTGESLRTAPYGEATHKEWTKKPLRTPFRNIFTELTLKTKERETSGTKEQKLDKVTQILDAKKLGQDGPVRILVTGESKLTHNCTTKHAQQMLHLLTSTTDPFFCDS